MKNEKIVLKPYIFDYESSERMCNKDYGTISLNKKSKFESVPGNRQAHRILFSFSSQFIEQIYRVFE